MKSNLYTVDVTPTFVASEMETGAYTDGDIIFKSTPVEIPRGIAKLISAQVIYRGNDGVAQASTFDLVFTKDEITVAAGNAAHASKPADIYSVTSPSSSSGRVPGILGSCRIAPADTTKCGTFSIATKSNLETGIAIDSVASNLGLDKFFMHGVARNNDIEFSNNCAIGESSFGAGTQQTITVSTTDATTVFAPGDVVHAHDNAVLGTIASVTDATTIVLTTSNTDAITGTDGTPDRLYCINPMEIRLVFEK